MARFILTLMFGVLFNYHVYATTPTVALTTTANSTISVTNTFQQVLAQNTLRASCLIQNTGSHVEYVFFGAIANATTSNAYVIQAGQTISCSVNSGIVLGDQVSITGTSGDGYIVTNQ
jgi:hypothetical protein